MQEWQEVRIARDDGQILRKTPIPMRAKLLLLVAMHTCEKRPQNFQYRK